MELVKARYLPGFFVLMGPFLFTQLQWWGFLSLFFLLFSYFGYIFLGGTARSLALIAVFGYGMAFAAIILTANLSSQMEVAVKIFFQVKMLPLTVPLMLLWAERESGVFGFRPEFFFSPSKSQLAGWLSAATLGAVGSIISYNGYMSIQAIDDMAHKTAVILFSEPNNAVLLQQQGLTQQVFQNQFASYLQIVLQFMPALQAFAAVVLLTLAILLFALLLRVPIPRPFSRWQLPWYGAWGVILAIVCYLAGDFGKVEILSLAGKNMICFWTLLGAVLGLSCVWHGGKMLPNTGGIKMLYGLSVVFFAYLLVYLTGILGLIGFLAVVGCFDMLLDFRRIIRHKGDKVV